MSDHTLTCRITLLLLSTALVACGSEGSPLCGDGPTAGNSSAPPSFPIEMDRNGGTFRFHYETRKALDRVQVFYEGVQLFDSGCVGETRDVMLRYGPGKSTAVDVVMTPNCSGTPMTSWEFLVSCPTPLPRPGQGETKIVTTHEPPRPR